MPRISRNPKVHYRTHKRPPPVNPEQASRMWVFLNKVFYREGLLAPRPTPKLEDHPSSAVRDCLFNLFAATLVIGGCFSIRNMRTRHAVVTGTHYMDLLIIILIILIITAALQKTNNYFSRILVNVYHIDIYSGSTLHKLISATNLCNYTYYIIKSSLSETHCVNKVRFVLSMNLTINN